MRRRLLLILLLCVAAVFAGCGKKEKPSSPGKVVIRDGLNLLDERETEELREVMEELTEYGNVGFVTVRSNKTSSYAASAYESLFGTESGILFVIDMQSREIYIETDGYIGSYITRGKARIITDNVYRYATNRDYALCAETAFRQAKKVIVGGLIPQPMVYASNAVLALVFGFLLNFALLRALNRKRDISVQELSNSVRGSTKFESRSLDIVNRNVVIIHSSSSGGGRGGFGGGGHHSHGGGHRF